MRRSLLLATMLVLLVAAVGHATDEPKRPADSKKDAAAEAKSAPTYAGEDTCGMCHDEQATSIAASPHRVLSDASRPEAQRGCEACHGPGGAHVEESGAVFEGMQRFDPKTPAAQRSAPCLACHGGADKLHDFRSGEHALSGVACTDCHRIHATPAAEHLLRKAPPDLCYGCHLDIKAKFALPEHHKVP
jgi:DmsE family decaheme c-type cytochrome